MNLIQQFRLRHLLAIFVAAPVTAAVLRYVAQVYGEMSGEEIRSNSLMSAAVIGLLLIAAMVRQSKRHG